MAKCPDCGSTDINLNGTPFAYCEECFLEGYRGDFKPTTA